MKGVDNALRITFFCCDDKILGPIGLLIIIIVSLIK